MKSDRAIKIITNFCCAAANHQTIPEQIALYEALGRVLPTQAERARATEIAVTLSELAKLQNDFHQQLFREFPWSVQSPKRTKFNCRVQAADSVPTELEQQYREFRDTVDTSGMDVPCDLTTQERRQCPGIPLKRRGHRHARQIIRRAKKVTNSRK